MVPLAGDRLREVIDSHYTGRWTMKSHGAAKVVTLAAAAAILVLMKLPGMAQQGANVPRPSGKLYNTAKQKLLDGKQIFSYTITRPDPELYCQAASHYDFIWLEMQHSTMIWADLEKMIAACPGVGVPMIRLPDEFESTIQHAT